MPPSTMASFLAENHVTFAIAFWLLTIVVVLLSIVRRSFLDTPHGHYHPRFREMNVPPDFDEGSKLQRIAISLAFVHHLTRTIWVACYLAAGLGSETRWYVSSEWWSGYAMRTAVTLLELYVISLFCLELVPQIVVAWRGKALALSLLPALGRVESLLSPLTRGFESFRHAMLRFLGVTTTGTEAHLAQEGIRAAVEIGEREGVIQAGEKSMIESVLEFHELEITEVMTPRTDMVCFEASITVDEAVRQAIECGHSRIPVYKDDVDHVVGVLYVKDLLRYVQNGTDQSDDPAKIPVEQVVRKINFVPETKKIQELLAEFRASRFHIAVVLDEYGGTSGLVTIEDIIEEIFGDIEDEYDEESDQLIRKIGEDTYDLDGRAAIYDFNQVVGAHLPESDDYETVAGFLMSSLGRVPQEGDDFEFESYRFEVMAADERKIKTVRVQQLPRAS
ncbi:MAG: CBS domain-containing protein [Planctomycetes bacterium]|nr:CBS domain-containing protein [Planctomycetota bacterium]